MCDSKAVLSEQCLEKSKPVFELLVPFSWSCTGPLWPLHAPTSPHILQRPISYQIDSSSYLLYESYTLDLYFQVTNQNLTLFQAVITAP